jgi:molybdate transport system substrate-binding protein
MMNLKSIFLGSALVHLIGLAPLTFAQTAAPAPAGAVQLYAAGSLREAMTKIASDYQDRTQQKIALTFGASGLLRERIEKGEPASVFA